jgi:hypothetical protein
MWVMEYYPDFDARLTKVYAFDSQSTVMNCHLAMAALCAGQANREDF